MKKRGDAGYLNFPLWIGGKWYFSYNVISRDFNIPVPLDHSCGVISYKKIAVRAGSFEAFEIRCNWKARGYDDSGQDTYWYAPKAKHIIKYETEKSPRELLEYEVK